MILRDYSSPDLRAALGSSPPLEKMKMGHKPNLMERLRAHGTDWSNTESRNPDGPEAAALITELVEALEWCGDVLDDENYGIEEKLHLVRNRLRSALAKAKVQPC